MISPARREACAGRAGIENVLAGRSEDTHPPHHAQAKLLADAAATYAQRGWPVFPVRPRDKRPLTKHGVKDATTDPAIIAGWRQQWPAANIGIATGAESGLWVLDIDGEAGEQSLIDLIDANGTLPATLTVATPRGGRHLYFRAAPPGFDIRNSAGKLGTGIDVRANGGYVVVPPSIGANGTAYSWIIKMQPVPAPSWLLTLIAPPPAPRPIVSAPTHCRNADAYVATAVNGELTRLENAVEGQRNHTLNRVAFCLGQFVKAGALNEAWYRQALESRALAIGLAPVETRKTIASAFAAAQPRQLPEVRS
jgi:hypothetical protein